MTEIDSLNSLIQAGVSPYHCIKEASRRLSEAGFTELQLHKPWDLKTGGAYFVPAYDSTLLAFTVDDDSDKIAAPLLRIAAAHTDWPCLKVKPSPEVSVHGYAVTI